MKHSLGKQSGSGPFIYKADVAGAYLANVITTGGCEVNSNTITITDLKVPLIVISTKSNVVCPEYPDPVFTAVPTYNGEFPKYQWQVNDANIGGSTATLSPFSVHGLKKGDKITCEMTSSDNCITKPTVISNAIFIADIPVDKPTVGIKLTTAIPCAGSNLSFAAIPTSAGDAPAYQWYVNGSPAANATSDTYQSALLKDGDELVCKIISNAHLCQVTNLAESLPFIVKTNPSVTPGISVNASAATIDAGTPVVFTSSAQHAGPNPRYRWMINQVEVKSATDKFTANDLKDGDQVSCSLISNADCTTLNMVTSLPLTIHVNQVVQLIIPGTFTPNGDGVNDTWQIGAVQSFTRLKVNIYNRYGQLVYQSNGYGKAWTGDTDSGTRCESGVYYYLISLDDKKTISGSVTLLR